MFTSWTDADNIIDGDLATFVETADRVPSLKIDLYDYLTRRLFKERLRQSNRYDIIFSKRGKSGRTDSLHRAIEFAPDMLLNQSNLPRNMLTHVHLNVSAATPKKHAGLQAVDYFVWALQRLYERGEDRYVEYLWRAFRLVHDIDDTRKTDYGVYYTQKKAA